MAQTAVEVVDVGMVGGVLIVGEDEHAVDGCCTVEGVLLLRDEFLPVVEPGVAQVGDHEASAGCLVVGEEVELVAHGKHGAVLKIHVGCHLNEL